MIRTRFAPSPTGPLHIGGLRTALFNFLYAKQANGEFFLRIEDTDKERSKKEWEGEIFTNFEKLGIKWDNIPERQSERGEIYKAYLEKMLEEGTAYYCFATKEELNKEREELMKLGKAPVHQGKYRNLGLEEALKKIEKGERAVIRFKCPRNKEIVFNDLIRGEIKIHTDDIGDFVIAKDLNNPLYNFTCIIDDFEMKITHIVRGEEHIPNTPKQILIGEALNLSIPTYAHLSLILGKDKKKLSKREGSTAVSDYLKQGYLEEAIINFIAFLGWNPGTEKEIYTMEELIKDFSIKQISKSPAIFNIDKLDWINGMYIRKMDIDELTQRCLPFLEQKEGIDNKKVVEAYKDRLKKLSQLIELTDYIYEDELKYDKDLLIWKDAPKEEIKDCLNKATDIIQNLDNLNKDLIQEELSKEAQKAPSIGSFMWPLRVALSGKKASASSAEIIEIIGKENSIKRIKQAINSLN
ncbi:MAG: glutamate--tRNA ligase [Candidatus Pacebacteria bacterium]|nr:glutamate--tRNA ligase [Candidatus Paceibacterota bacterium]